MGLIITLSTLIRNFKKNKPFHKIEFKVHIKFFLQKMLGFCEYYMFIMALNLKDNLIWYGTLVWRLTVGSSSRVLQDWEENIGTSKFWLYFFIPFLLFFMCFLFFLFLKLFHVFYICIPCMIFLFYLIKIKQFYNWNPCKCKK